jgi:phosphatidate cytidylyltransferase
MAPGISPGKTWEGALGGLVGAVIIVLLFQFDNYFHLHTVYWQAVILALLISIFGQLGDLVESLLKRNFNVKDSGNLMPGHGGILDRLDSVLFAGVVVYLWYFLVVV